jgi:TolB-like protein
MSLRGFLKELHHRNVFKVAVAYAAAAMVLLEVLTHLFHNFEAPHWVLKVVTTLLIMGLPVACLMAWGFEFREGGVRSIPRTPKEAKPALPAPETTAPPSIAVLPFADMSAEHDQQYLGDGIAEELLNALASIEALNVAARTSSFAFAGKGASMTEIGDTLHVRHVLEGSVRRSGQKLRVTAQLIDVRSGFHLYSQSYDRKLKDIFDIQNDIAHEIAGALLPKLGLSKDVMLVRQGTTNLEAYNFWLMAHQWIGNPDPNRLDEAVALLQQAIKLDQNYADAWGDLAYLHGYSAAWLPDPIGPLTRASSAATVALLNAPDNPMALLALARSSMLIDHDPRASAEYFERARTAGVDQSAWAFNGAYFLDAPFGRYADAIPRLEAAKQRDPLAQTVRFGLIDMYRLSGRIREAVAEAEDLLKLRPLAMESAAVSGFAFLAAGDVPSARKMSAELQATSKTIYQRGSPYLVFAIGSATGEVTESREALDELLRENPEERPVSLWLVGEGYKAIGEYTQALDAWTRAVDRHEVYVVTRLAMDNRTHPVIGKDPRFLALLKRMGQEPGGDTQRTGT